MEHEFFIDTEEIANYLTTQLIARGFVPTDEEVEEIADIVFDYLIEKNIIEDDGTEEIEEIE